MNVVAIIQARTGSSRLPGKVLADLAGGTMLARVVRRVRRARLVDRVAVATTTAGADDPIAAECRWLHVDCFRGAEDDVLDRYLRAATCYGADVVVRITADCPLADPAVVDRVVRASLGATPDYASNVIQRTWPRGLDTEAFTASALRRAWREADEAYERVHVTPYFYRHPERFRLMSVMGPHDLADWRWTVDCHDDLSFVREIYRAMGGRDTFSWHEVRRLLARRPALADLNRHVRQKAVVEG